MRRAVLLTLLIAACKQKDGGLEVVVSFQGFQPGCLDVVVTDREDPSHTGSSHLTVTERRAYHVAIARAPGWTRHWKLDLSAHEGSCAGAVVASVTDDTVDIPPGLPIQKSYELSATDGDGDGWVALSMGGTDCDDANAVRAPGLTEVCADGLDNDCKNGADCDDSACLTKDCDDHDACTTRETCVALGQCSGGGPLDCGLSTLACRKADAGVCTNGACSWPLADIATPCGAGVVCNGTGVCVPANTELNCADGIDDDHDDAGIDCFDTDCQNGSTCDAGRCVPGAMCSGTVCMGAQLPCNTPGTCHDAGVCNPATGACDYPLAPLGSTCRGNACQLGETCDAVGNCSGGAPMSCASGPCQTGFCDGGACFASNTSGTCDDDAGCTFADTCVSGTCQGTGYGCAAPGECQASGACLGDGGCSFAPLANGTPCDAGAVCLTGTCTPSGFQYPPSNVNPLSVPPRSSLLINCDATFDSNDGGGTWCGNPAPAVYLVTQDAGTESAAVISVRQLALTNDGGSLTVRGSRPVIILAFENSTVLIDGLIDARATQGSPGPGGNLGSCGLQVGGAGTSNATQRGSGGGGGGYATRGGWGGSSDGNNTPGADGGTTGPTSVSPLVGGCPGGHGGNTTSGLGGLGGAGGGALQISSAASLRIGASAVLTVSGGGGPNVVTMTRAGGGGGGSGGTILLEAVSLDVQTQAWLTANGGAGAEASDATEPGDHGDDGASSTSTPAAGGTGGADVGGAGGNGAAGASGPGNGIGETNGGGGGGSVGRIHLRAVGGTCLHPANFSPAYTNAGGCP